MNKKTKTEKKSKPKPKVKEPAEKKLALRFCPTAWAKLLYFRDRTDNEVGGFGITKTDDLLYVTDFVTVKQDVTSVSVKFDDESVATFFDDQVDLDRKPEQFARIWLHTHPGSFAEPSATDESTFKKVFGNCQWAVMFIIAEDNKTYAQLDFNVGPGAKIKIPVEVDYTYQFGPTEQEKWDAEYAANVTIENWQTGLTISQSMDVFNGSDSLALPYDFLDDFEDMTPAERQYVLDELACEPQLWDREEVMYL